ncbi:mandelate racemase/muconate lactonizing enzyme family protein [Halococcoides cellulosivorans]|uniref:o-succinylbenzoate synthase n=1 Tax=Halococcoides cellulosivorans TaxID=1679096 RepID=A0A2R4X114_9EURY|nr:enolase C-terminal domain-like protein [Halococcoides cellulosivorans]AWB27487.1 o-succinylbenzoate synthase [Halococcoides cellulosivorans]
MEIERFSLPLDAPLATADGTIADRDGWVVTVTHEGTTGIGEATPLAGWTEPLAATEHALGEARENAARHGLERAVDRLDPIARPAARHGVECAALDAKARLHEEPLWATLGGSGGAVPLNATIGRFSPEETAERARAAAEQGFPAVKCKAGADDPAVERERIARVAAAVPDAVAVRIDANGAWSPAFASAVLSTPEADALDLIEQPVGAGAHAALRQLRTETGVSIALDESVVQASDPLALVDLADAFVCKPMALGGLERTRTVARGAIDAGLDVVVSTTVDAVLARTAAAHLAASLPAVAPSGLATGDRLERDLAPDPATIADGQLTLPDRPGLGIEAVSA